MPDEEDKTLNQPNQEEEEQVTPPEQVEQPQEDAPEEQLQEQIEEEETPVEEEPEQPLEEHQPSRREQLRIQNLLQKYGNPYEQPRPQPQGIDYRDMIDADEEVYDQLSRRTQEFGNQQYQQGLAEANALRFQTRLEVDAPKVEAKYPQLDKHSDSFKPAVADALNQMYLSSVGYDQNTGRVQNSNVRYSDYIDAMFELVNEAADRQIDTTRRNVTRQAANTGLRPDGSTPTRLDLNKDPTQMTDKELDAALAKLNLAPKKR